jgi:hypothetical protein
MMTLVEAEVNKFNDPDLDSTDWNTVLNDLQRAINKLQVMRAVHKFERVSKEVMDMILQASMNGESTGKKIVAIKHTISDRDTLRTIELRYSIPWQDILDYNGITVAEFYSRKEIDIPFPLSVTRNATLGIAVFGDQSGSKILGTGLPNELSIDTDTNDLHVLSAEDNFLQAIRNISIAEHGDLPFYESYGLDLKIGEDYPTQVKDSMLQLKIADGFAADPRVKSVNITDIKRLDNAVTIGCSIEALTGQSVQVNTPL